MQVNVSRESGGHRRLRLIVGARRFRVAALVTVSAVLVLTAVSAQASGPAWTLVNAPSPGTESTLYGVSCTSSTLCMAVGDSLASGLQTALAERWNGTTMVVVPTPPLTGDQEIELDGVSCSSASYCIAVGRFLKSGGDRILTEKWTGATWSVLASPTTPPGEIVDLNGVSCKSPTFCMAVGAFANNPPKSFAMKWNGSSWTVETVPNISSTQDDVLNGVSCTSPTFCIGVGFGGPGQLIDRWNGSAWSIVSSTAAITLQGVRCRSTTFCMAVGDKTVATGSVTLAEKWNGTVWSVVSSPNVSGSPNDFLSSVSCTGPKFCMAGGEDLGSGAEEAALTEMWNGSAWTVVASISPSSESVINAVSCTTATGGEFCLAVGQSTGKTLAERYS